MLTAFRQAWASWKTAPGVALLAVVAFAVGIGSATAIFTVVNGVLRLPVPYPHGDRFVSLHGVNTTSPRAMLAMSAPELQDYQQKTISFDAFGWFRTGRFRVTAPGEPHFVPGAAVTPTLARELGAPRLGQWFVDDTSAVISTSLWRRLGGERDIIGRAITLDGRQYTITGVMPPAFQLPLASLGGTRGDTEVWIPLDPSPPAASRSAGVSVAYARRKPGVSLEQAQADARRIATVVAATDPARYQNYTAGVADLRAATIEMTSAGVRAPLLILLGAAGLLLLIACANVATLLLARSVARTRETAIRVALGASRRRLALSYFAEGALVSVAGAAAGVGLSFFLARQILAAASGFIPRVDDIAIDWTVLGFSVAIALATGVLAGLAPLWQAMRTAPRAVLADGVRASASAPAQRLSKAFVVAEIALAFTLLTTSAILVVHTRNLERAPLGFDSDGLVAFNLSLPRGPGTSEERAARRYAEQARLMNALRQTPGVTAASFASTLPAGICGDTPVFVEGRPTPALGQRICPVIAGPDFLSTMQIPLRAGRLLNESDSQRRDVTAVLINEAAARAFWSGGNPIGASVRLSQPDNDPFEVVGVVADVRNSGLNRPAAPEVYLPAAGQPTAMNVVVRSDLPADQMIAAVRRSIGQTDPTLVMEEVRTIRDVVLSMLQLERLSSLVITFFGLAALVMATLGIYGVMSYFVRQRTMELGTRMALGAVNRDLVALVLGGGLKLAAVGVTVGSIALVGAIALLARYLAVADFGWLPLAGSTTVVGLVAGAAAAVPAWRATLLSPMVAIREQPPSVWQWARAGIQRAVHDIREAVRGDGGDADASATEMLTAFVDAARGAHSYSDALRAMLAGMCGELDVQSAALLGGRAGSESDYRCLVAIGMPDAAVPAVAADGFLIRRLRAYPLPLAFAPGELDAVAEWAAVHRPERLAEVGALASAGIRLAVPLRTRDEIVGVLLLGERSPDGHEGKDGRPRPSDFDAHQKQVLRACANQFALMIENARLIDRAVEQETLRRDIALAADVQRRLLPDAPPEVERIEFAAASVPARRIGGDYYDFVDLRDRAIGIALADVSGKGVAAALIMSVVQASLRIISSDGDVTPPRLVARMNEFVYRSTPASKYATFFYAQLDASGRRLRYVNAGHNPPYLLRAAPPSTAAGSALEIEELSAGGTVVGMFPEMEYDEATVELYAGDVLLAFTDGVPEAHNPEHEEFGEERLRQLLQRTAHLTASAISLRLSEEIKQWIRDAEQYDDLTFIVIKVRP